MFIRFNRSQAVRKAYQLYDRGEFGKVIRYCTEQLKQAGADPELLLLRARAYDDRDKPNEAFADLEACCADTHLGGVAHYYLGNFLSNHYFHGDYRTTHGTKQETAAWGHFDQAIKCGWVEGHIGKGDMLLNLGFQQRDEENQPDKASDSFRQAIIELTAGLNSPSAFSRKRALGIRASVHYNLGDIGSMERDHTMEKSLVIAEADRTATDPRATGGGLFA